MHYIFIINDIEYGTHIYKAEEIMAYLIEKNIWAFSTGAPKLKSLSKGDEVIIYLAGKRNRCFAAVFTIDSAPIELEKAKYEPEWMELFPFRVSIANAKVSKKPCPILSILADLDFIKDKKNYGLFLRQSIKNIKSADFARISKEMNK